MFSAAIPLLYPLVCGFMLVYYWFNKSLMIRFYQRPNFDEKLPKFASRYLKVGIVLHVIFGALMITNGGLIPNEETMSVIKRGEIPDGEDLYERFLTKPVGIYFFTLLILTLTYLIFQDILSSLASKLAKLLFKESPYQKCESDCIYKELAIKDLRNIYTKTCSELE